jgi:pSer/pThr/pTyr-binding forkhead associated (FHA) protein
MPILALIHEGLTIQSIPIEKDHLLIGRSTDADIYIDDKMVSNRHAKIITKTAAKGEQEYHIEDLDSTNHTFVNGEKITRHQLVHEDHIRIGKHLFKFVDGDAAVEEKTTKLHKSWIPGVYYTKE